MTLKEFFLGRTFVFGMLLLAGLGVVFYMTHGADTEQATVTELPRREGTATPVFTWRYAEGSSLNLDGIPETDVFLEVRYPDGSLESQKVDTVPGGCNELADADDDHAPMSTVIQCYSAGLGYRYKVSKGEREYFVQRKKFEEASPEYEPPFYDYQVIARFPSAH